MKDLWLRDSRTTGDLPNEEGPRLLNEYLYKKFMFNC